MVSPPDTKRSAHRWLWAISAALGVLVGIGVFTFVYAEGFSYFSNDPNSCMNCHIMRDQFEGWSHSSHKAVAACNDCHTPHAFPQKYIVKGINGFNHSLAFTLGNFAEPIQIKGLNAEVAHENCLECHATAVSAIEHPPFDENEILGCVRCHGNVGHGNTAHGNAAWGPGTGDE
jgi:cytochrome c nitrite reductase small subunit